MYAAVAREDVGATPLRRLLAGLADARQQPRPVGLARRAAKGDDKGALPSGPILKRHTAPWCAHSGATVARNDFEVAAVAAPWLPADLHCGRDTRALRGQRRLYPRDVLVPAGRSAVQK